MSNVPCVEKFKAMVAAMGKLTTAKCAMTGAAQGVATWGRQLYTDIDDLVYANDTGNGVTAFHAESYSCAAGTACYSNGIWKASNPTIQGTTNAKICNYWDAIYPSAVTSLLKSTPRPEDCAAASLSLSPSVCGSSAYNSFQMWQRSVPVENELFIDVASGHTNNQIGNYITGDLALAPDEGTRFNLLTDFKVYSGTGFPDVLPYLPQGATILGAIGQVKLNSLTVQHDHVDFDGSTSIDGSGCATWSYSSNASTETLTDPVQIKIAAVGQKNDGTIVVLQDDAVSTGGRGLTDEWIWVDMTSAVKALFAGLNGPYKAGGMHLLAYSGSTLDDLAAAQYDDSYLLKLRAKPTTLSCSIRADGSISAMAYELDTYKLTYSSMSVQNVYVAFQLPASAVSRQIGYFTWPGLD